MKKALYPRIPWQRIMQLTAFPLLLTLLVATFSLAEPGRAQQLLDRPVTVQFSGQDLRTVLAQLERATQTRFVYKSALVRSAQTVSITARNERLASVLDRLLKPLSIQYEVTNDYIILNRATPTPPANVPDPTGGAAFQPTAAQDRSVTGRVTDAAGQGLPGVNVTIKNTSRGATTDAEGTYRLTVPEAGATLVFSFIGYLTQEIEVGSQSRINLQLTVDNRTLNEVVVVGYGTQKRADLTGSIASVGNKDLKDFAVGRADQALAGKLAGVQVKQATGQPGAGPQIRVRGFNSISQSNSPLIVIDGVPGGDLGIINPNDIESIDVLKDASAAAIYGSRASNGVVLVTTKRGQSGKTTVTLNAQYGQQSVAKFMDLMNAREAAQLQYDGWLQRNLDEGNPVTGSPTAWRRPVPQLIMDVLNGTNTTDTDWQRLIFRTAPIQTYQVGVSGGSERMRYYLGSEFLDQQGILLNTGFKRYGFRLNLDGNVSDRLKLGSNLNFAYTQQNQPPTDGRSTNFNALGNALVAMPFYPAQNADGSYVPQIGLAAGADIFNPLAVLNEVTNRGRGMDLTGNVFAQYTILDGLSAKVLVGAFVRSFRNNYFQRANPAFIDPTAFGSTYSNHTVNWLTEYTLNYDRTFAEKHNVSVLAGYTAQQEHFEDSFLGSNRYPNNLIETLNAVGGQITSGSSFINDWSLLSMLGRVNYNYAGRYYLTAALRRDGSSRFGANNRWGTFPSAAVAWRVSEEAFMRNQKLLSNLKLRAAIGTSGNFNIPDFAYLPTVGFNNYALNNAAVGGYFPNRIANPDLRWERQSEVNVGLDLGFLNDRLNLSAEYFVRNNTDLLLNVNVPGITGFQSALRNIGQVENRGIELTLGSRLNVGKLRWSADLNYSLYRNEVKALGSIGEQILFSPAGFSEFSSQSKVGQPVGMFWGWIVDGVIKNQAELDAAPKFAAGTASATRVGDLRFRDVNNDGKIDGADRTVMGNPHPKFLMGFSSNLSYAGFELNVQAQGVFGSQILQAERYFSANMRGRHNHLAIYNYYWRSLAEPGDNIAPRAHNNPTGNNRAAWSTLHLDEGSFVRINNLTLAYNFPRVVTERIKMSGLRLYANATNAFTFTKYTGYNPDVSSNPDARAPGIDSNNFPVARVFSLGANLTF